MKSRHNFVNIPTETARTILIVQQAGSLTKAAQILGLTQPAVSLQLRRIEAIIGGAVFEKSAFGSQLTELGRAVLQQCRRMIEANDQIVEIGGFVGNSRVVRVGVSTLLIRTLLLATDQVCLTDFSLCSERSAVLRRQMLDGKLDIALLLDGNGQLALDLEPLIRQEFTDELVWVRSERLSLSPGEPIPIVAWADDNDPMARVLTSAGIRFRLAFSGGDFDTKRLAVESGMGLSCLPNRQVPPHLLIADDYNLPKLPRVTGILCVNPDMDHVKAGPLMQRLLKLFFDI